MNIEQLFPDEFENEMPPDTITEKLLPCPFCGRNEFFRDVRNFDGEIWVQVKCDGCGATGSDFRLTEEQFENQDFGAIYDNWQNRTQ